MRVLVGHKYKNYIVFLVALLFHMVTYTSYGQENIESILKLSEEEIISKITFKPKDSVQTKLYAKQYLLKAKSEMNSSKVMKGYLLNIKAHPNDSGFFKYADSLYTLAKRLKNKEFEGHYYFRLGIRYYQDRKYKEALGSFLNADELLENNKKIKHIVAFYIAVLRNRFGEYKEVLDSYQKLYSELKVGTKDDIYFKCLLEIAETLRRENKIDSAMFYTNLGLKESSFHRGKEDVFYNRFLLNKAILKYTQSQNDSATYYINQTIDFYKKIKSVRSPIAFAYYYKGLINEQKRNGKGISYFLKIDSVYKSHKDLHPELRTTYEELITYYKKRGDIKKQLEFTERLLQVDRYLQDNYEFISESIANRYEMPKIVQEKEETISKLNKNKQSYSWGIIALILITLSVVIIFYKDYKKKEIYKKRFEKLINQNEKVVKEEKDIVKEEIILNAESEKEKPIGIGISEEIIESILKELEDFEQQKKFLKPKIKTIELAKEFNTNAKYLSKVVNHYKEKSITNYINDLRIDYVIHQLGKNEKLRKYTIKAIAAEIGFSTPEAFSKSFFKKTGIYPSYYIKELSKIQKTK